ncbi:MAG: Fic family protein [Deltaproteobacteria bacterium]
MNATEKTLGLFEPTWNSPLAQKIIELEHIRARTPNGDVPQHMFTQIKSIFHMLESLGSGRIEGNRTTLAEYVEKFIVPHEYEHTQSIQEIVNIENAISFIEENITPNCNIEMGHIREMHRIVVQELPAPPHGESSMNPGEFRKINVAIAGSSHKPPDMIFVDEYMEELLNFINQQTQPQNHLLITAIAHHRMAWIHPFDNGNGRVVRMLTYATLRKQGFLFSNERILNPTAIFCNDRNKYYDMLAQADGCDRENVLTWCEYVITGIINEIEKIDKLLHKKFLIKKILYPAIEFAIERQFVTQVEAKILKRITNNTNMEIKSADIEKTIGETSPLQRSRIIKKLKDKKMIFQLTEKGRIYHINFINNCLLRGVMNALQQQGFIPDALSE